MWGRIASCSQLGKLALEAFGISKGYRPALHSHMLYLSLLFLTALSAAEWQPWGPFGGSVLSLAIDPHQPSVILAGARNGQLFRSVNRGQSWQQLSFGKQLSGNIKVLVIDPAGHYWAGLTGETASSNGLWQSADSGITWTQGLAGLPVESVAQLGSTIAVGTRHGAYLSNDGSRWDRITPQGHADLEDIVSLAFDSKDARILYAGTPHLPWKTTDGGATWAPIHTGMLDDSDVFSLQVSAADPSRLFASACSGIYRSQNAGARWKLLEGIPNSSRRTHVILEDPQNPGHIYAGTTSGLYRTTDSGEHWTRLNSFQINSIVIADKNTLYLATEHAGVQISHDRGATLQASNMGLHARNVAAVTTAGASTYVSTVYEGNQGGVFIASGGTWRRTGSALGNIFSLAADGKRLFAASSEQLYQSLDSGRTWIAVPTGVRGNILSMTTLDGQLWVGTSQGLYRGSTTIQSAGKNPIRALKSSGAFMLARSDTAVFVSPDRGANWKAIPAKSLFDEAVSCKGSVLLATSEGLSSEGLSPEGIPQGTVSSVAFHPLRCQDAFAAQFGHLYISHDAGIHWTAAEIETPLAAISELWVASASPDWLCALVPGSGVFRINLQTLR